LHPKAEIAEGNRTSTVVGSIVEIDSAALSEDQERPSNFAVASNAVNLLLASIRCNLYDPRAEEALYVSKSKQRMVSLQLYEDAIPSETTILNFHHLLERHNLTNAVLETIKALLGEQICRITVIPCQNTNEMRL
jgi:Transposase domain (DUF772)